MRILSSRFFMSLALLVLSWAVPVCATAANTNVPAADDDGAIGRAPAASAPPLLLQPPSGQSRQDYATAVAAIRAGNWQDYQKLRPGLEQYPLAMYLDYYQLTGQLGRVRPQDATSFLERSADSPLPPRFLSQYLRRAGAAQRWTDFLTVWPQEPNSVELKCYYFRAKLAQGDRQAGFAGARKLWLHGKSQPKACDPLFRRWEAAGELTDDLVWERMLAAFAARQGSLMRYVSRKGSAALQPWSERLQRVYRDPSRLDIKGLSQADERTVQLVTAGLIGLARYSPEKALARWQDYSDTLAFSPQQTRDIEHAIALQGLFARSEGLRPWLPDVLQRLQDNKLVGIRLRWALAEQDWQAFRQTLPLLSAEERQSSTWRYWQAVALIDAGQKSRADELLSELSTERGFYNFLAADYLKSPYAFNARPPMQVHAPDLQALPAVSRISELHHHEERNLAHSEWAKVLRDRPDPTRQEALAQIAAGEGWHRMAIDAANRARAWDVLDLRFPTPYRAVFQAHAVTQNVPSTELMAIARRESAFFPEARSSVGARGLMQIMPATGAQVARQIGQRHRTTDLYEIEHNVRLGSAYYRQLLDRYGGNRIFALAAYNAGPHRVDRWRSPAGDGIPVDLWIETIPFKETREYVQAVLAYNVVFQYLIGDTLSLLTVRERQARY